jgi:hypothetical protein
MNKTLLLLGGILALGLSPSPVRAEGGSAAFDKAVYERARYKVISKTSDEDFAAYCVTMHIGGDALLKFHDEILSKRIELAKLISQGLGPDHPQVMALNSELKDLKAEFDVRIGEARKALELESQVAEETLSSLGQPAH